MFNKRITAHFNLLKLQHGENHANEVPNFEKYCGQVS